MAKQTEKPNFTACPESGTFTVRTVQTGKDWLNILWNEKGYQSVITHTGVTSSCRVTLSSERITLNRDKSCVIYLRDDDTDRYFSPGGYPCGTEPDDYRCEHALAYSEFSGGGLDGIRCDVTFAVHPDELCEVRKITVTNGSARTRKISLFVSTVFDLGGYAMPFYYNAPTTSATEYVKKAGAVLCLSQNPYGSMQEKSGFIASYPAPDFVCGSYDDFVGITGSESVPECLTRGEDLSGGMATVKERCGILQHKLCLNGGESKTVYCTAGFVKDEEDLLRLTGCIEYGNFFDGIKKNSATCFNELTTQSPSEQINTVLNRWAQKQVSFCRIGKKAVRDNSQLAVALLNYDPALAKATIEECLVHQYGDGHAALLWYPVTETAVYSDPAFWLTVAIAEYIKETDDIGFLQAEYDFCDGGRGSVLNHIYAAERWYLDRKNYGSHGLPKIYKADWNDALNIPDENAESVFMATAVCYMLGELADLYDYIGEHGRAATMRKRKSELADTVNRVAWNGEYYVRALSKFGAVGDKGCDGGEFYFNPQSWAIMAGIVPPDRLGTLLQSIDKYETDEGVPMCVPPYLHYDERVGRMSGMLPGVYENGGIYNHAGCFKVMADCFLNRRENATKTFLKILPDGKHNKSSHTGLEPYVFSNCYLKHPAVDMKVASSWQTGTSAWGLRCYYEGILGLRRAYGGLKISPCIPAEWKTVCATREYRGAKLSVRYSRGKNAEVTVNGTAVQNGFIPAELLTDGAEINVVLAD